MNFQQSKSPPGMKQSLLRWARIPYSCLLAAEQYVECDDNPVL